MLNYIHEILWKSSPFIELLKDFYLPDSLYVSGENKIWYFTSSK
jgi:hypothetical protein